MKNLIIIFLFITVSLFGQQMKNKIIPIPQKLDIIKSSEVFETLKILEISFNHSEENHHKIIKEKLSEIFSSSINFKFNKNDKTNINFNLVENFNSSDSIPKQFEDEAYTIDISENSILIKAKTLKGIYYSVLTFSQIVEEYDNQIPQLKIIDFPNMKFRGISDDFSRGQVSTLENFKRIIKFISEYKMNTYMPYMEDVIQFDTFPEIGVGRGALSKDEIREIVKFADEHFVEVIPIFQTLGHYENILSMPEFIKFADFPGAASLDVTNPEIYPFLEKMLEEVFELFPSQYFHIGGDESYDVGKGNSRSLLENSGLATIHANHYKKIFEICKKHYKKIMMYGDILLENLDILNQIPKDIIIVDWHYFPTFNYPSTKTFSKAGFNFIVSPSVWNFNSAFPENFFAVPNIQTITEDGIRNNSIGMINSSWGDFGAETFREYNLYGYAWSAQCAWNILDSEINNFNNSFFKQFFKTDPTFAKDIYEEFNLPTNQILWNNLWRHPLLEYRRPDWRQINFPPASKLYSMQLNSKLKEKIKTLKNSAKKNKDFVDLLEFTSNLKEWFTLKQKTQIYLHEILDSNFIHTEKAISFINDNISKLNDLKSEYSILWKKYNRVENLWMLEDKFDRMIAYFEETKNEIEKNSLTSSLLRSDWIYYPNNEEEFISEAEFKTSLLIEDEIKSAKFQIIGDTYAKLIINGKEVDSVYTKRGGSIWVEQIRIKLIDVAKYLKVDENEIIVEAKNFYDNKTPGINIISEIITQTDTLNFTTNENWQTKKSEDEDWISVEVKENPLEIISPNFANNRKSWIER